MCLAADWCRHNNRPLPCVVTVDHRLRENSATEAATVSSWAAARGLEHKTLQWQGTKKLGNIQAQARQARYERIGEWMKENSIQSLVTGHTLDDHAETFLIRLARGSGLEGLTGMSASTPFPSPMYRDLTLLRPLLGFAHERLKETLRLLDQPWIEDPTNSNPRYLRAQLRDLTPSLHAVGITPEKLAATMQHLGRANDAIRAQSYELIGRAAPIERWGYALIDVNEYRKAPPEVALRALSRLLQTIGGQNYPPEFESIENTLKWLRGKDGLLMGRTLGGCRLHKKPGEQVLVAREEADAQNATTLELHPGGEGLWDGRFVVTIPQSEMFGPYRVQAINDDALRQLGRKGEFPPLEPNRIAKTLPCIWRGDVCIAAPTLKAMDNFPATVRFLSPIASPSG